MAIKGLEETASDPRFWAFTPIQQEKVMVGLYGDKWGKFTPEKKNKVLDYMANEWGPHNKPPINPPIKQAAEGVQPTNPTLTPGMGQMIQPSIVSGIGMGIATQNPAAAALGGVAGEASEIISEGIKGNQQTIQTVGGGQIAPPKIGNMTTAESYLAQAKYVGKRVTRAALIEGFGEASGVLMGKVLTGGFRARSKDVLKKVSAQEAIDLLIYWREVGGNLPTAAASPADAYILQVLDKLGAGSFTGGGSVARTFKQNVLAEAGRIDDFLNLLATQGKGGLNPYEAGALVADIIRPAGKGAEFGGQSIASTLEKEMFKVVDDLNEQGVKVSLDSLYAMMKGDVAKYTKLHQPLEANLSGFLKGAEKTLAKSGTEVAPQSGVFKYDLNFSEAQFLRSRLLYAERAMEAAGDGDALRLVKKWTNAFDQAMETASTQLGPESSASFKAYRKANAFVVRNKSVLFSKTAKDLMKIVAKDPDAMEQLAKKAFQLNDANAIRNLRRLFRRSTALENVGRKRAGLAATSFEERWREVQHQYMQELFDKFSIPAVPSGQVVKHIATQVDIPEKGLLRSEDLLKFVQSRHTKPIFDEMFKNNPIGRGNFIKFLKASALYKRHAAGGAMMVIQLAQGGAVAALPSGSLKLSQVLPLFITPWALAKALYNPSFTRWIIEGMQTASHTARASVIVSRLAYYMAKEGIPMFTPPSKKEAEAIRAPSASAR